MKNLILFLIILVGSAASAAAQESVSGKVIGVVDGDTITVLTKEKRQLMFKLAGIDAPERDQDYGMDAKQFLSDLVLNKTVTVSNSKKDCLDRMSGSVIFKGGDLSAQLVKSGNAWMDSACQSDETLAKEQAAAKEKKIGLWQNLNPVHPAEFRKSKENRTQAVNQPKERRIFTGIAPAPPPILTPKGKPTGLYIGMGLSDFTRICGDSGERSTMFTTEYTKSFSVTLAYNEEKANKGCYGYFKFRSDNEAPGFKLTAVDQ